MALWGLVCQGRGSRGSFELSHLPPPLPVSPQPLSRDCGQAGTRPPLCHCPHSSPAGQWTRTEVRIPRGWLVSRTSCPPQGQAEQPVPRSPDDREATWASQGPRATAHPQGSQPGPGPHGRPLGLPWGTGRGTALPSCSHPLPLRGQGRSLSVPLRPLQQSLGSAGAPLGCHSPASPRSLSPPPGPPSGGWRGR